MEITQTHNGRVQIKGTWLSWITMCYLLMWPINTELNNRSVELANRQLEWFVSNQRMLDLELKVQPVLASYNVGLDVDMRKWHTLLQPKVARMHSFQTRLQLNSEASLATVTQAVQDLTNSEVSLKPEWLKLQTDPLLHGFYVYRNDFIYLRSFWENVLRDGNSIGDGTTYNLTGNWSSYASYTGRMRASRLPMMALPKKIRSCLKPRKCYYYVSVDLSNVEFRIAAALTGCQLAQLRFRQGIDIHQHTGRALLKYVPSISPTNEMVHQLGKRITFCILYGGSTRAIVNIFEQLLDIRITISIADAILAAFFDEYPELRKLQRTDVQWVQTLWGSQPLLVPLKRTQRINLPIQLMGSFLLKLGLCVTSKAATPIMSVHDEIIFLVRDSVKDKDFMRTVQDELEVAYQQAFPKLALNKLFQFTIYR
ncbi:hypothetical protein GPK32_14425 [Lactiplantibacillus plantarum]|uniref:DNA polymerase n=1 Tax=Lactiplantibacillus plantarum TaxID=1590 RepID=UPI0012FCE686|nr:DNA polymerase [Lactiplantibacillus plantarum]QGX70010.1 hypothetical protein GPK32_14425 [Lactiplantibacillus plantarum]